MICSSALVTLKENFYSFWSEMKDCKDKTKQKRSNFIPPKDITAHKISYNFLERPFYYLRRPFIGFISSYATSQLP